MRALQIVLGVVLVGGLIATAWSVLTAPTEAPPKAAPVTKADTPLRTDIVPPDIIVFETSTARPAFTHKLHYDRVNGDCTVCHTKIFPQSQAPLANYGKAQHRVAEAEVSCAYRLRVGATSSRPTATASSATSRSSLRNYDVRMRRLVLWVVLCCLAVSGLFQAQAGWPRNLARPAFTSSPPMAWNQAVLSEQTLTGYRRRKLRKRARAPWLAGLIKSPYTRNTPMRLSPSLDRGHRSGSTSESSDR